MPTLEHNSLIDYRGRRAGPRYLARGNHYPSVIDSVLGEWNGQYVAETSFDADDLADDRIDVFLFLQDQPVSLQLRSIWGTSTAPYAAVVSDWEERVWTTALLTGNAVFTPIKADCGFAEQGEGQTVTNGVAVKGYLLQTQCLDRLLMNGETPLTPSLHVRAIAESGELSGWHYHTGPQGASTAVINVSPVILRESDYTAAIQGAGDLIEYTFGGGQFLSPVVGLYGIRPEV